MTSLNPVTAPHRPPPMIAVLAGVFIVAAVLMLNIPYFALTPGPAPDVGRLITIQGAETHAVNGKVLLTTVSLHEIRAAEALRSWIDDTFDIVSRDALIPKGDTDEQQQRRNQGDMQQSHITASAAALSLLGYDVKIESQGVRVHTVYTDSPAIDLLRAGDEIRTVDGTPVVTNEELQAAIRTRAPGENVRLGVRRDGRDIEITTATTKHPQDETIALIGIEAERIPKVTLPLNIEIDSLGIGGPSAGLSYAIGIVDLLNDTDLAQNRIIAGTGEITVEGAVLPVGGIKQKVAGAEAKGAELFIAPKDEVRQACRAAGDELSVVGVETLQQAVDLLSKPPAELATECR